QVTFTTNLGTSQPSAAETDAAGRVIVRFNAGAQSGTATITAISGGVAATGDKAIKIQIGAAAVGGISVNASPATLPSTGGTSTITAAVNDSTGNPSPAAAATGEAVTSAQPYGTSATTSPIPSLTVDWGDGLVQNRTGQPAPIAHTYGPPGSHLGLVTGFDPLCDASTTTTSVTVNA